MKRAGRQFHKWLGLISCTFILLLALTAIGLNHHDLISALFSHEKISGFSPDKIKVMASDPFNPNHIIASDLKVLFESKDNGKNWTEIKLFVPAEDANNIVFDPFHKDKILISLKKAGVYISDDGGQVWDDLDLPFSPNEGEYPDNVSISKERIHIKTRFALYTYDTLAGKWNEQKFTSANKKELLNFDELIYNLHTGKIFGSAGVYVYDLLSIGLILLAISGIYLSVKPKSIYKNARKVVSKNEIFEEEADLSRK